MKMPWLDQRLAANGIPICDNFSRWFMDSKVVDPITKLPLVVYHGSALPWWDKGLDEFDSTNGMGEGAYFTPFASLANEYAEMDSEVGDGESLVIPVYLSIQKPKIYIDSIDSQSISAEQKVEFQAEGYDGVFGYDDEGNLCEIAVFDPSKIKSAIGNSGLFLNSSSLTDFDATIELQRALTAQRVIMEHALPRKRIAELCVW